MRYIGTHMHLHSCYEVLGSMHGHCMQAKKYGLEAVWFTDHDTFMGARRALNGYDFEKGLFYTEEKESIEGELDQWMKVMASLGESPDREHWRQVLEEKAVPPSSEGFKVVHDEGQGTGGIRLETSDAYIGSQCMRMEVQASEAGWKRIGAEFTAWKKRMNRTLIADVSLGLALRLDKPLGEDCRIVIEFAFSQQPPELRVPRLVYCAGNTEGLNCEDAVIRPLTVKGDGIWQYVILPISQDAEAYVPGGLDNAFQNMMIWVEARGGDGFSVLVDQLNMWEQYHLQELMLRQRQLGKEIGEKFGIKAYVTTEVSKAGHHKNCFSLDVPIMDYPACGYHITHEEAVQYLKDHNAVFAYNHPFIDYQNLPLTDEQREKIVDYHTKLLIDCGCYGAPLLEVGFPKGRYGFSAEHFVQLWDQLGMHGIYMTGYGDSDNHRCDASWADGNNFASYIAADQPELDDLCNGMLRGDLYTANPAQPIRLESFTLADKPEIRMGSVVKTDADQVLVQVTLTGGDGSAEVRWVDDGVVTERMWVEKDKETFIHRYHVNRPHGLCRIGVYDKQGRCLLISNPIYFSTEQPEGQSKRQYFELVTEGR